MTYHLDPNLTDLSFLKKRLESTDLIPSQEPLLDGIDEKILSLQKNGINTFNDLLVGLKTANSLSSISKNTGINPDYLSLLRRVVSGFFAKPRPLKDIDWLDQEAVVKLNMIGVKDTKQFYEAVSADGPDLARKSGMTPQVMMRLMEVSDLCRIQWVSPTFARVLAVAGFTSAEKVAQANPEALYEAVIKANEGARYYKGKVGLRDIKRLVVAASYVPQSD